MADKWSTGKYPQTLGRKIKRKPGPKRSALKDLQNACDRCGVMHPTNVLDVGLCPACVDLEDDEDLQAFGLR